MVRMNQKLLDVYKERLKTVGESGKWTLWMLDQIPSFADPLKQHRWLGFVQGFCWTLHLFTIDEMREHVRLYCGQEEDKGHPVEAEAEKRARWISVAVALPPAGVPVETKIENDDTGYCWCLIVRNYANGIWNHDRTIRKDDFPPPTHWHI